MKTKSKETANICINTHSAMHEILNAGHFYYTLDAKKCCDLVRCSRKTLDNWVAGRTQAPYAALELLHLYAHGRIIPSDKHWLQFQFNRDKLVFLGSDYALSAFDIKAAIWHEPIAKTLACENASLKGRLNALAVKPALVPRTFRPQLMLVPRQA